ncbi:MAG: hypothetical protein K6L76_01520 [Agarilytica sp.]
MRLPKFKELKEFAVPKGVGINSCERVLLDIDGVKVSFLAPPHRPSIKEKKALHNKKQIQVGNGNTYTPNNSFGRWRGGLHFGRDFAFQGPAFTGSIAELSIDLLLFNTKLKKSSETLFDPSFLEASVLDRLTEHYSEEKAYWAPCWQAPSNWKPINIDGVSSVSYDAIKVRGGGDFFKEYVYPIFDDTFFMLRFREIQETNGSLAAMDKLISREPLDQLANDIIKSVQVELSEEAKQQLARAKQEFPNVQLSQDVQPLKWTTEEEDRKHSEYLATPENY